MSFPIFQVDAFTSHPYGGNPAGVCILLDKKDDAWMQNVAAEMNLSETAFLLHEGNGYRLRWFTPTQEVDLCGHATLASAFTLFEQGYYEADETIEFYTKSGTLKSSRVKGMVEINLPRREVTPIAITPALEAVLKVKLLAAAENAAKNVLVEVEDETVLTSISPDFDLMRALPWEDVAVTCKSDRQPYDFISRFFAPRHGVNEDPVTGSAHCMLTPYWAQKLGKETFSAYQASKRGGELFLTLDEARVRISGRAVIVMHGEILH